MIANEEISLLLSSDPQGGAINRSSDGSYFEVQLQDGIKIPEKAINCQLSCESAEVWWTIPNVTSENNKLYVTGPSNQDISNRTDLGFPEASTYEMTVVAPDVSNLELRNIAGGMPIVIYLDQIAELVMVFYMK